MIEMLSLPSAEETEKFIAEKAAEGKAVADMTIKELREEIAESAQVECSLPHFTWWNADLAFLAFIGAPNREKKLDLSIWIAADIIVEYQAVKGIIKTLSNIQGGF